MNLNNKNQSSGYSLRAKNFQKKTKFETLLICESRKHSLRTAGCTRPCRNAFERKSIKKVGRFAEFKKSLIEKSKSATKFFVNFYIKRFLIRLRQCLGNNCSSTPCRLLDIRVCTLFLCVSRSMKYAQKPNNISQKLKRKKILKDFGRTKNEKFF